MYTGLMWHIKMIQWYKYLSEGKKQKQHFFHVSQM